MSKEVFRMGELFCGPGGIACGAHRAVSDDGEKSIVHAWANDVDQDTCDTYIKNIDHVFHNLFPLTTIGIIAATERPAIQQLMSVKSPLLRLIAKYSIIIEAV